MARRAEWNMGASRLFIESNPVPVKFAMAAMGLCEEVYRLPMVPPRPASKQKILDILKDLGVPVMAEQR